MTRIRPLPWILPAALAWGLAFGGSLEGRWRLVEETYGGGKGNLAGDHRPVEIDFQRAGAELSATIRIERDGPFVSWPAAPPEDGRPVRLIERAVSDDEKHVRIRYVVEARPEDDLALEIVEDYRVAADGRSLVGTVDVALVRAGEPAGSYRLHRRFEKLR